MDSLVSSSIPDLSRFWESLNWFHICNYLQESGYFHQQAKKLRKTLISTGLWLFNDLLMVMTDVNAPMVSMKQKTLKKVLSLLASWKPLKKSAGSGLTDPEHYFHYICSTTTMSFSKLCPLVFSSLFPPLCLVETKRGTEEGDVRNFGSLYWTHV
jgi:hypothetical protein